MSHQQDYRGNENGGQRIDASNWLPITASRNAKWYYSAFHNVTAVVGAGILGLPYAMSQTGWFCGSVVLVLSWLITFYSFWQLVEMHEMVPGKRFDRYPELGQHCFGPKLGYWVVMPQQLAVQVATGIVYGVTGGKSLKKCFELIWPAWGDYRTTYFILFFVCLQFVISQAPNFNSLKGVSLLAAIMSIGYAAIAFFASTIQGVHHREGVSYGVRSPTVSGQVFDFLNGCGTIAFAFAGHSVSLEIQATIPSTAEKPSKYAMWKGVVVAYVVVAVCYGTVSVAGYWAYGKHVEDDVLISLMRPAWLIALANFMVFVHVIGSYQVFSMPVFDQIEQYLVEERGLAPGRPLRIICRSIYVAAIGFVSVSVPFFGGLLGLFGGLFFASTSYFMPCIMWLVTQKPKRMSFHWTASWISIVLGFLLAVLSPIGGAHTIIVAFKTYSFFS
ncbi:hypothetical protein ACLB2K_053304 [Fragaria x ananassa]